MLTHLAPCVKRPESLLWPERVGKVIIFCNIRSCSFRGLHLLCVITSDYEIQPLQQQQQIFTFPCAVALKY